MAVKLARSGRDVVVLEAGGRSPSPKSQSFFEAAQWRERRLQGRQGAKPPAGSFRYDTLE
jgi:hypothetical protein